MKLDQLPVELLLEIAPYLSQGELAAICRAQWVLNNVFTKPLYDKYSRAAFLWAAKRGDMEILTRSLRYTAEVNTEDNSRTALSYAAERGHEAVVKLLLGRNDVKKDPTDGHGRTPLSWAAAKGQEMVIKLLLDQDEVKPDCKDINGQTPLLKAALNGEEAAVKLLLETKQVDPDSKDINGRTPLWWAIATEHITVAKLILKTGLVVDNPVDSFGRTTLPHKKSLLSKNDRMYKRHVDQFSVT
jgi:ankyrin repeat protein